MLLLRPLVAEAACVVIDQSQEPSSDMSHCEDISLRPPHGGDGGDAGVRQWRHKPEVLVKGCCNYSAQVGAPHHLIPAL